MKIVGIIAEFNPMHKGHKFLIEKAKEITGADVAICVMSGNFTQAGNIAIVDKFKRAKTAIKNGIDAVIELPTIYATSSAEYFSFGAVNILNSLNCVDYLCFGSETGDTRELVQIAYTLVQNEDGIWDKTTQHLKSGLSFAQARQQAIAEYLTEDEITTATSSNNILAIEYIKAIVKLKSSIQPIAIKREEGISATNIRELIQKGELDEAKYLMLDSYDKAKFAKNEEIMQVVTSYLVAHEKGEIKEIRDVTEGLESTLKANIDNYNYTDFVQSVKSKRYQLSKIKRIVINILLEITKDMHERLYNKAYYAHILGINKEKKSNILSLLNDKSNIPILASLNDNIIESLDNENKESLKLDIKATNIHSIIVQEEQNKDYTNRI